MRTIILLLTAFVLTACAMARDPAPIAATGYRDAELNCIDIYAEYKNNTLSAEAKIAKNIIEDEIEAERGCFLWPRLPDIKNADGVEGNALLARNVNLLKLAAVKGCDVAKYPLQPDHYR